MNRAEASPPAMTQPEPSENATRRHTTFNSAADLLHRIIALLDGGRKDLLRQRYAGMMGVKHLDDPGQEKQLMTNKAYQRAKEELEQQTQRDRKALLEVFDAIAIAP